MLTSVVGVIVLLGGLIFFHELGHYSIAKLFGVKVEVFSLGFGKKIFHRKWGETEYALSLIPFGGYVKLMGDDPYKGVPADQAERAFSTQKLYKRFLIVAAGPLANLLLAFVLFSIVFWNGQPMAAARLGTVNMATPAYESGLRSGDRIAEVNAKPINSWTDLENELKAMRIGDKAELKVERAGNFLNIPAPISAVEDKNEYGEDIEVSGIKGIAPTPLASMIGISDPKSIAYTAGLRTGDVIIKVESKDLTTYGDLNAALTEHWAPDRVLALKVRRGADTGKKDELSLSLTLPKTALPKELPAFGPGELLGMYPSELFVRQVSGASAAEKGGVRVGDRMVRIGKEPLFNFQAIIDSVQAAGKADAVVPLTIEREGQQLTMDLKPVATMQEDPLTHEMKQKHMLGIAPFLAYSEAELTSFKIREPITLITHSVTETFVLAKRMLISLVKLAVGQISVKNLGGPVLIASVAGKSLDAGIIPFLQMMALISINLFLLNLFPVPILDGGHLLFFIIEGLKGKPVSIRTMEIANQIGMVFILMLVGLTLFNDISRIVLH